MRDVCRVFDSLSCAIWRMSLSSATGSLTLSRIVGLPYGIRFSSDDGGDGRRVRNANHTGRPEWALETRDMLRAEGSHPVTDGTWDDEQPMVEEPEF